MWKIVAVVFAAFVATVFADVVVYKDCGSTSGTIHQVEVTPCPTEPCQFERTKTIQVVVNFTSNVAISKATTKVYGYILGIKTPFPVPSDACGKNMTCPIAAGTSTVYKNAVYVQPVYPHVSLVVQWEVHDQDDKFIMCFQVPVQVTG